MGIPPSVTPAVLNSVGPPSEILADDHNLVIYDGNLANYLLNDWSTAGVSAPGVSAGGPNFPMGALLGFRVTTVGASFMKATSSALAVLDDLPVDALVYTWASAAVANRGSAGAATIPLSVDDHAVVLAQDVDITDYITANQHPVVPIIYQGNFVPDSVLQDQEGLAGGAAWPVNPGSHRINIVPKRGYRRG